MCHSMTYPRAISVPQLVSRMDVHHLPRLFPDTAAAAEALNTSSFYTVIPISIMPNYKGGNEVCCVLYATFGYVFCVLS